MKKLPKQWVDYLTNQPETGAGYQKIIVTMQDGQKIPNIFVYNAEDIDESYGNGNDAHFDPNKIIAIDVDHRR